MRHQKSLPSRLTLLCVRARALASAADMDPTNDNQQDDGWLDPQTETQPAPDDC
jgi:hypothetical protein